jgi:hypothetical protein
LKGATARRQAQNAKRFKAGVNIGCFNPHKNLFPDPIGVPSFAKDDFANNAILSRGLLWLSGWGWLRLSGGGCCGGWLGWGRRGRRLGGCRFGHRRVGWYHLRNGRWRFGRWRRRRLRWCRQD